ncbi:MAG TPA: TauD/TfdA family dioxygenase [Blastocatellia bacterium]|jgi:alpha-ketoglutarate-dependent taurine dioxygenase
MSMSHEGDEEIHTLSQGAISTSQLQAGGGIPLALQPEADGVDLVSWARSNARFVESLLLRHGALLFRNFNIDALPVFKEFAESTSSGLMPYSEPSTPRTELTSDVYTTTEYPATENISLHNEMSYSHVWPMKIWFHCIKPADTGGETCIGDSRKVFQLLSPDIREEFARRNVMYVRNYGYGMGLPWQTVFRTTSKDAVEKHCRENNIRCEWTGGGRLRTYQVRQAVAKHPKTGEEVWFNQAHIHNIKNFSPSLREALLSLVESKDFPLDINCVYGDGADIEASVLEEIRNAYGRVTTSFPWQRGDILMLDNMLVSHGRSAFSGRRKIAVALGEPFAAAGLQNQP